MAKILCIGLNPAIDTTLQLSNLTVGAVNRAVSSSSTPAGKAINVATILSKLGHDVSLTGFLGQDNADVFCSALNNLAINNHCIYVQGNTRQNIKLADQSGQITDINSPSFVVTEHDKASLFTAIDNLDDIAMVVLSGSLPSGFELADFGQLIDVIHQQNKPLAIDTSGQALKMAISKYPFLIKPNLDELAQIGLNLSDIPHNTAQLATNSVISMGEHGVLWQHKHTIYSANAPKIHVKSTVGAGDTLLAMMIHGLLTNQINNQPTNSQQHILTQAVAMASYVASIVGVDVADEITVKQLAQQIAFDTQTYNTAQAIQPTQHTPKTITE